jgi:hypothetical protein
MVPLTIEYLDLLKTWGHPDAPAVQDFVERHRDDSVFQRRVQTLNNAFLVGTLLPQPPQRLVTTPTIGPQAP